MRVRVPATTANIGSGFDCVGIALDWYDEIEVTLQGSGLRFELSGEGADSVPQDESHLVIASIRRGLEEWGDGKLPPLTLRAHNTIPHARGLGSSAAAIVGGLMLAWGIAREDEPQRSEVARVACLLEGHADNAAAAVLGGATLGWIDGEEVEVHALHLHPELRARVWVPEREVSTQGARSVLPQEISRSDAVMQAAAAATLILALEHRPDLLLRGTSDRLHQRYRADLMPESLALIDELRALGVPATVSGAGPSVFAIGTPDQFVLDFHVSNDGFRSLDIGLGVGAELIR